MTSTVLQPVPPFDLHLTANHQTYYQREFGTDQYQDGVYSRALTNNGLPLVVMVHSEGTVGEPRLRVSLAGEATSQQATDLAAHEISRILTLQLSLRQFYDAVEGDTFLHEATKQMYGLHPPLTASVYEALVMAIIGQQISGAVARSLRGRVVRELGLRFSVNGEERSTFPEPEAFLKAGPERLRGLGLSGRKAEYILGIAASAAEGGISQDRFTAMENAEVVEVLTRLRGVGPWTAQWVLLRALGRPDAFPAGDLALQRLIGEVYLDGHTVNEKEAKAFAQQRWGPFTGLATTYLFAYIRRRRVEQETRETLPGA